jgi:hypothetical protein
MSMSSVKLEPLKSLNLMLVVTLENEHIYQL